MALGTYQVSRAPYVWLLGSLALVPLGFMVPEIVTLDAEKLNLSVADVLGIGSLLIFTAMLVITPLSKITGVRWFTPLRWWYGVMFFTTAFVDLIIASIVTGEDFTGGFVSRIAGHTFLAVGMAATLLSSVLAVTANHRAQRWLGRYWRRLQRTITYLVWFLIVLHLLLLFGVTGRQFINVMLTSVPLAVLRFPAVDRWVVRYQGTLVIWLAILPLVVSFLVGYYGFLSEEIGRGWEALTLNPVDD